MGMVSIGVESRNNVSVDTYIYIFLIKKQDENKNQTDRSIERKVGLLGEIVEKQLVSNVTDDNGIYRKEKLDITMCPTEETGLKTFKTERKLKKLCKC